MNNFQILRYDLLLKVLEDEILAKEVLRMVEQNYMKNKAVLSAREHDDFEPLQSLLHQLKGTLPMLTTPEFSQMLHDEALYLQQNLTVSDHFSKLQEALETLQIEINDILTSNHPKDKL